jgi:hypothetical protein
MAMMHLWLLRSRRLNGLTRTATRSASLLPLLLWWRLNVPVKVGGEEDTANGAVDGAVEAAAEAVGSRPLGCRRGVAMAHDSSRR